MELVASLGMSVWNPRPQLHLQCNGHGPFLTTSNNFRLLKVLHTNHTRQTWTSSRPMKDKWANYLQIIRLRQNHKLTSPLPGTVLFSCVVSGSERSLDNALAHMPVRRQLPNRKWVLRICTCSQQPSTKLLDAPCGRLPPTVGVCKLLPESLEKAFSPLA